MSRITVVLFHLLLTASVTVWANSERQLAQVERASLEGSVVSDQPVVSDSEILQISDGVTTSDRATDADKQKESSPTI